MTEMNTEIKVMPLRFTDHFAEMRDFLALLGFSAVINREGKWAKLAGASGLVALHAAEISASGSPSGRTELSFETNDADGLKAVLAAAGYEDTEIIDEAWGRVLTVRDGRGTELVIDERSDDLYGYEASDPRPAHDIEAMPLVFEPPDGPLAALLTGMGFTRVDAGEGDGEWQATGGGRIFLHGPNHDNPRGGVSLCARTREPLPSLAERLRGAGYSDVRVADEFGGELYVSDPDGQTVSVFPLT